MTETEPKIDFTQIAFPSDNLTVKTLRSVHPEMFDVDWPKDHSTYSQVRDLYDRRSLDEFAFGVFDFERLAAERAFKMALGQSVEHDGRLNDRDELVEVLVNEYKLLGLARGEHEALALFRRIETQAEAQARQHGGRPR